MVYILKLCSFFLKLFSLFYILGISKLILELAQQFQYQQKMPADILIGFTEIYRSIWIELTSY